MTDDADRIDTLAPVDRVIVTFYGRRPAVWVLGEARKHEPALTIHQLRKRARRLGVSRPHPPRPYSEEERRLLVSRCDELSVERLAELLGRTPDAVLRELQKLGVTAQERRRTLSVEQIAELLDRGVHQVRRWIREKRLKRVGLAAGGYQVRPKDLRAFLVEHPWAINVRHRGELPGELVQLLAGRL